MGDFSIVLDDDLYGQWHNFIRSKNYDRQIVERLLHLCKPPILTNVAQLKRLGIDDSALKTRLAKDHLISQSLEELSEKTLYKMVLSSDKDIFPFVNIFTGKFNSYYTMTFAPGEDRSRLHSHLRGLFEKTSYVLLHDVYLADQWKSSVSFFKLFPRKKLSFFLSYSTNKKLKIEQIREVKSICNSWTIKKDGRDRYGYFHDRYVLLDDKLEILITSGIDYVFDDSKECTVVFRSL